MKKIESLKIALATHYRIYSVSQALRDYIRVNNCPHFLYVSHPLPLKATGIEDDSYYEVTAGEKIIKKKSVKRKKENIIVSSVRDLFLTLKWGMANGKFELFIGVDNLNAMAGIILKKLGIAKKVVYYTIDYFPTRFNNKLLNSIYHFIDRFCVANADETWNISSVMVSAREKHANMSRKTYNRQYSVPNGIWYDKAPRKTFAKINKKKIIFVGHLLSHMGVDLGIRAMPEIISKIPDIEFEIIGGGEEEESLKKLSEELGVSKNIKFWGWIRDRQKLEEIMSDGAVGLATFNTEILDDKVKNADPGKIKDYMLLGMPVIATDAISTAEEIRKKRCGFIVKYNASDLAQAVIKLLNNEKILEEYRKNALEYVSQFDYNKIFSENLRRVLNK